MSNNKKMKKQSHSPRHNKQSFERNRLIVDELKQRLRFEELISDLSSRFVNLPDTEVDYEIKSGLKKLVEYLGVDRSTFIQFTDDHRELVATHSYAVKGVESIKRIFLDGLFPWMKKKVLQGEIVSFSSLDELPEEAATDMESLKKINQKSNITIPLSMQGSIDYLLAVGAVKSERVWPRELISRLRLIGQIFANAMARKQAEEKIRKLTRQLEVENYYLKEEVKEMHNFENIIGESESMKYVFYKTAQAAPTDATILIEGETGTGKELFAYAIHNASKRKDKPLIKVNCTTLPTNLIESELFGHEKGAFSGALMKRIGRFELADNATIFLDEITEIPPELQSKLLRVLQEGEYERLGSSKTKKINIRVIAATNLILEDEVKKGKFRKDLFYRLNVYPITIPPLRERKDDIPLLVEHFVKKISLRLGRKVKLISRKTVKALQEYPWPGNVRELA